MQDFNPTEAGMIGFNTLQRGSKPQLVLVGVPGDRTQVPLPKSDLTDLQLAA